jgi:hypothetical protein
MKGVVDERRREGGEEHGYLVVFEYGFEAGWNPRRSPILT